MSKNAELKPVEKNPFDNASKQYPYGYFSDACYSWVDVVKSDYTLKNSEGEVYERGSGRVIRPRIPKWYRKDKPKTSPPDAASDTA